jgi:hypothetical protein
MIKLIDILKELGEGTKEPYKWTKTFDITYTYDKGGVTEYSWTTEEGARVEYEANITKYPLEEGFDNYMYSVEFGIKDDYGTDYKSTSKDTETGNLFRVMATMVDIVKTQLKEDREEGWKIAEIRMSPSKRDAEDGLPDQTDRRRTNLYASYIKKNMPEGSRVQVDPAGDISVYL